MKDLKNLPNFKFLVVCLVIFAVAIGYLIFGFTSKCGSFEGKPCPRGFKCNLTEKPGYVVYGHYDQCTIKLGN